MSLLCTVVDICAASASTLSWCGTNALRSFCVVISVLRSLETIHVHIQL